MHAQNAISFSTHIATILLVLPLVTSSPASTYIPSPKWSLDLNCSEAATVISDENSFTAPQQEGNILLPKEIYNEKNESTGNSPDQNCTFPPSYFSTGRQFNWWQILLDNGGKPGTLRNISDNPSIVTFPGKNPCQWPLDIEDKEVSAYDYKNTDFKTYFREEMVYRRFANTSNEYLDVRGSIVWVPPLSANDTRGYHVSYAIDTTGFWIKVLREECKFQENEKLLFCEDLPSCYCSDDEPEASCIIDISGPSASLLASLVGR